MVVGVLILEVGPSVGSQIGNISLGVLWSFVEWAWTFFESFSLTGAVSLTLVARN